MAELYGWDAVTVSQMTFPQLWIYTGHEAQAERNDAEKYPNSRIDKRTGHRVVTVQTQAEAMALMAEIQAKKNAKS